MTGTVIDLDVERHRRSSDECLTLSQEEVDRLLTSWNSTQPSKVIDNIIVDCLITGAVLIVCIGIVATMVVVIGNIIT